MLEIAKAGYSAAGVELNLWLVLYSRIQARKQGLNDVQFFRRNFFKVGVKLSSYSVLEPHTFPNGDHSSLLLGSTMVHVNHVAHFLGGEPTATFWAESPR